MYTGILMFLLGAIVGMAICAWRMHSTLFVGELHVIRGDEEQPYLYAALGKSVSFLLSKKYVLMQVKEDDYVSQ